MAFGLVKRNVTEVQLQASFRGDVVTFGDLDDLRRFAMARGRTGA